MWYTGEFPPSSLTTKQIEILPFPCDEATCVTVQWCMDQFEDTHFPPAELSPITISASETFSSAVILAT